MFFVIEQKSDIFALFKVIKTSYKERSNNYEKVCMRRLWLGV